MRIAIIERRNREYLNNILSLHPDFPGEIVCYADWNPNKTSRGSIPVVSLSELKNQEYDTVLIADGHNHRQSKLLLYLHEEGITNIYVIRQYALNKKMDFIDGSSFNMSCVDKIPDDKPYLVHLETHICDYCNLNCKACNNFSPFCRERSCASSEQFEQDLKQLTRLFSAIGRIYLLGGEPLLEPEACCVFVKIARKYFPHTELRLLTNGLLIPKMQESFWNLMREKNVIIHISVYPPTKEKMPQILETLYRMQVSWHVAKEVKTFAKRWTDSPLEDAQKNNAVCGSAGCHYLRNGKITKCPDAELIQYFDTKFGTHLQSRDFIKLDETRDGWKAIESLEAPIDLCSYCTLDRMEYIPWEPVGASPDMSHWLVENRLQFERKKWVEQRENAERLQAELNRSMEEEKSKLLIQLERSKDQNHDLSRMLAERDHALELIKKSEEDWHRQATAAQYDLKQTKMKLEGVAGHYRDIHNSFSFKIGRILTWLPRKVRDLFRHLNHAR